MPILILGASGEEAVEDLINFDITPSVFTYEFAKALSYEAERKEKVTKIHIKIDTGMSRIVKSNLMLMKRFAIFSQKKVIQDYILMIWTKYIQV